MDTGLLGLVDSAELERVKRADVTILMNRLNQTTAEPTLHDTTIAGLESWAAKLKTKRPDQRFDHTTGQIIWRAVVRANYYWFAPLDDSIPRDLDLVPRPATDLARAAQQDSVFFRAHHVGNPSAAPRTMVQVVLDELTEFIKTAVMKGCQTNLAHLAMLLWADESLNQPVDRAGMRERIYLAFNGVERRWESYIPSCFASQSGGAEWLPGHRLEIVPAIWNRAGVESETDAGEGETDAGAVSGQGQTA